MKIALVHDWFVTYGGSEKVVEQILECFPDAEIFSLVDFIEDRAFLRGKAVTTSFIQRLPFARTRYRSYLPLFPLAVEQFNLKAYDLVISSSHAVAKGVLTGPEQLHISYVHSPMRYAWDLQHQYLKEANLATGMRSILARTVLHYIRTWDTRTANGVDVFIANSNFIARRISKCYRRDATVIYPPVDIDAFSMTTAKDRFYLTVSRMVPYKKMDLIVEAFSEMPDRTLVVIGDGPDMDKIRAKAGANIKILGYQSPAVLKDYLQRARAFVFAAEEDFGIAVVEAQACGTPVIAFRKGGASETVVDDAHQWPTGVFFEEQTIEALHAAVVRFESNSRKFLPENCRANAERFSIMAFRDSFSSTVSTAIALREMRTISSRSRGELVQPLNGVPPPGYLEPRRDSSGRRAIPPDQAVARRFPD